MAWFALAMLGVGLALMATTGWASYAVLLLVSCVIAAVGLATGALDAALLQALPARVLGLLEHDLLQAVALYALVGALLRELDVAGAVIDAGSALGRRLGLRATQAEVLGGYALGALAAPMNGSVGACASMLARTAAPRWRAAGLDAPDTVALTAAAATLGAIVPPSLVLLLLGDAMMRAHTEALGIAGTHGVRVINTQDLVQAGTPVAVLLALAWAAAALWATRHIRSPAQASAAAAVPRLRALGVVAPLAVAALLALVALGRVRAVEAAATAAVALFAHAWASGRLRDAPLVRVLDDAMSLTGALFALLLAATTLSLVLRASGCDLLVARGLARLADTPGLALTAVLGSMLLLAFVLDAFEIVFVVVPLVMPPLLALVPDAAWVACLALLVLQAGFLLPPWGYAVVLARALALAPGSGPPGRADGGPGSSTRPLRVDASAAAVAERPSTRRLAAALVPYLAALAAVLAVALAFPGLTHWLRSAPATLAPSVDAHSVDEMLRQMSPPTGRGSPQ
ncbi:MAG: TRAP transporter large permease subunit [Burkholderiales bacterium]|nr:TRAP transporter large permease subunit [Burkholderiales bacterium]